MRKIGALLTVGLLLAALVSCSSKDSSDVSSGPSSTESDAVGGDETPTTDGSDSSAPDGSGDVGLFSGDDCAAASTMFVTLGLGAAFLSDDQRAEIEQQLGDVRDKVPAEVQDDIETIRDGVANASNPSELGDFFDSPEFEEASGNLEQYLEQECGLG